MQKLFAKNLHGYVAEHQDNEAVSRWITLRADRPKAEGIGLGISAAEVSSKYKYGSTRGSTKREQVKFRFVTDVCR